MLNLVQISERLKGMPLQAVMQYANGTNPEVPPYIALAELQRRKKMEQDAQQSAAMQQNPQQQPTVKQGIEQALTPQMPQQSAPQAPPQAPPQQGAPQMPQQGGVPTLPAPNMAKGFAPGGIVSFNGGDESLVTNESAGFSYDPEKLASQQVNPDDLMIRRRQEQLARLYGRALGTVPTIEDEMNAMKSMRQKAGISEAGIARQQAIRDLEAQQAKSKEGRGLEALAAGLTAYAGGPRRNALARSAQALGDVATKNKAADMQYRNMIMDAKLKLEDSQRAAFTGDMTAAAQRRSEAMKEARDAEKMLIDAGFKQEEINRLRENAEREHQLRKDQANLAERKFQQDLQEYKEGPERAKALAKYRAELERQNRVPTMQEIAMYGLSQSEQAALARSVITQKGQGSDRRLTQKEATEIVDNRIARDPNIIKNQQKRDKDAGKPIRDEDTIRRDLINEELTASEAFGGIAGAPRSGSAPTSHPADRYK
jgi:hypothetical protein